ncbi:hypothetical protein DL96DRAFT_1469992 [Flagelloscypha sp. PMI_526]|nr:hypothetical protein DL96DRAFT_1469992 [Flagelloscypha sp. PMI_526]
MAPLRPSSSRVKAKESSSSKRKLPPSASVSEKVTKKFKAPTTPTSKTLTKPKAKAAVPKVLPQLHSDSEVTDDEEMGDEDPPLHGLSSDEDGLNSSDDEIDDSEDTAPPINVSKLPTVAKDDETVKRKLEKAKRKPTDQKGVIYIGRLPHGFYEDQLKSYFSQFGDVSRLRVSRNKKTGKSKHYAFLEFTSSEVATIVAETMDNYLLSGHLLQCKVIAKDEIHPNLWIGANRKFKPIPTDRLVREAHNKERTPESQEKVERRLAKRRKAQADKLKAAGIVYSLKI